MKRRMCVDFWKINAQHNRQEKLRKSIFTTTTQNRQNVCKTERIKVLHNTESLHWSLSYYPRPRGKIKHCFCNTIQQILIQPSSIQTSSYVFSRTGMKSDRKCSICNGHPQKVVQSKTKVETIKFAFFKKELQYQGLLVSEDGVQPLPEKHPEHASTKKCWRAETISRISQLLSKICTPLFRHCTSTQ